MSVDNNNTTTKESEKDLAQTPWWFIESLKDYAGIHDFDLDVCANKNTSKCNVYYSLEEDENSLVLPWGDINFCNPPFTNISEFLYKARYEAYSIYSSTYMILPNNPETKYIREAKQMSDTIIEMPFRMKFLRPNGEKFLDKKGKESNPKFSCIVAVITPLGLKVPTRHVYHDFRVGFYKKGE